ncbi:methyltransferase domain-containing protein, partial [Ectothiorhodospiraceae bacterium WFHF3C12]|nr:methyltransferase domain-containing protein [Ectothiorhodospiraceae bacterium WFHF3C12]
MVAILGYTREQIFAAVKDMYTAVAEAPDSPFHFLVGRPASLLLGYPQEQIERLPSAPLASFAGVGYPFRGDVVRRGDICLDVGAGSGTDSLIAAQRVGSSGYVIALDMTPAMAQKLGRSAQEAGAENVGPVLGAAEAVPLANASVDCITSNGAFNLIPDKRRAAAEMFRVLRPGGRLQIADVVIGRPVTVDCDSDPRLWVECVVGATVEDEFLAMFRDAGFEDIQVLRRLDYFAHTPSEQTREIAAAFGAQSVEVV